MPAARARATKTKTVNGRTVSAKSKTGDPACSAAMSEWVLGRATGNVSPEVNKKLGECRAKSRALRQGAQHRAAGNEGKAQRLEALAAGRKGPITAKDRLAKAKEIRARRAPSSEAKAVARKRLSATDPAFRAAENRVKQLDGRQGRVMVYSQKQGDHYGMTKAERAKADRAHEVGGAIAKKKLSIMANQDRRVRSEAQRAELTARRAAKMQGGGDGAMGGPSLRQQADAYRAAKGMTPEQRSYAAATKWQNWRVGSPTAAMGNMPSYTKLDKASAKIQEGDARYPEVTKKAATEVRRKIESFKEKRQTPSLQLSPTGPKLVANEYDGLTGKKVGVKPVSAKPEESRYAYRGQSREQAVESLRTKNWNQYDVADAGKLVASGDAPPWLREQYREYTRIAKAESLTPTAADEARQRKILGIKGRMPKASKPVSSSPASPQPAQAKAAGRGTAERMAAARALVEARRAKIDAKDKAHSEKRYAESNFEAVRRVYGSGVPAKLAKQKLERNRAEYTAKMNAKRELLKQADQHRLNDTKPAERHFGSSLPTQKAMNRRDVAQQLRADRAAKRAPAQPAVSPRAARYNRLEAEVFQGKKDGVSQILRRNAYSPERMAEAAKLRNMRSRVQPGERLTRGKDGKLAYVRKTMLPADVKPYDGSNWNASPAAPASPRPLGAFGQSMTPLSRGKAKASLDATVRHNGEFMSRKAMIDKAIKSGAAVQQSKTGRRLTSPSGAFLDEGATTKTGMNYAEMAASRFAKAQQLRADRAAKRASAQPAVSPRAARYNRLEAEVFQGKKDVVPYVGLNQGRGERFGDPQVAQQVEARRNAVARAKKMIRSDRAKQLAAKKRTAARS